MAAENEKDLALGKRSSRDDASSIHGITLNLPNSEGVMLFVVREIADSSNSFSATDLSTNPGMVSKSESGLVANQQDNVQKYLNKGYRMADVKFFSGILSERLGVNKPEMDTYLNALKTYAKRGCKPVVQAGGVYLGRELVFTPIAADSRLTHCQFSLWSEGQLGTRRRRGCVGVQLCEASSWSHPVLNSRKIPLLT